MSVIPCISYFSFSGFALDVPLLGCTPLFTAGLSLWYRLFVLQHGVCVSAKCIPLFFLVELMIDSLHFWERISCSDLKTHFHSGVWYLAALEIFNQAWGMQRRLEQNVKQ